MRRHRTTTCERFAGGRVSLHGAKGTAAAFGAGDGVEVFPSYGGLEGVPATSSRSIETGGGGDEEFPEAAIAVERGNPSMLANGSVSGTIEDMLYGMSATTQEEMMTGLSITHPPQDAVQLSVVEKSTVKDPLRSAEILWVLTKMPILNPRDVCYLKATGVGTDRNGKPYGYLVLHSVDLPECPPFDYRRTKVLRAKLFFSFLFRETSPGYVDVMGRGIFDLAGGELLKFVLPHATTALFNVILKGGSCGEAKKLTLLAFRNYDERRHSKALTKKSVCSMCIRGNKGMLRLRSCDLCGVPICKKCKIKDKRIFTGTKHPSREAVCCATCSQQAKGITGVRLGEPEFIVVAEYYSKSRPTSSSASSGLSAAAATLSTLSLEASARQAQQSTVERDNDTGTSEPTPSLLSDPGKTASSVAVTNSTVGDSCASFDFDVSFSSDRNSSEYRFKYGENLDEEPDSGPAISAELLAELGDVTEETAPKAWSDNYGVDGDDFAKPVACYRTASKRRPNNMLEWMMELQSSAEEAYITAKANEEIMKKAMRPSPRPAELHAVQPELRPVGVPLSPGCFQATDADRVRYTTLIRGRVDSLLRDEVYYAERRARNDPFLHAGEWKQVKKEKDLTFYRRLQRGRSLRELALEEELPEIQRAVERGYKSMICDGFVKGTIEDMMYGMTASSQDDLMTGFSFKDPPKDCVWLGSATGVEMDAKGEKYGYMVLHGVHIAQCPPFAAHGISRAKMYFACLFQEPRPGVLKVTVRGIFDLSKKVRMLKGLVSAATTSIMVGLFNGIGIGEAKKLTLLAKLSATVADSTTLRILLNSHCATCAANAHRFSVVQMYSGRIWLPATCVEEPCAPIVRVVSSNECSGSQPSVL
ncbi:START-like domain [Phytophthora cactorum]|nr:START-like domain [Phytophthora cactorum]